MPPVSTSLTAYHITDPYYLNSLATAAQVEKIHLDSRMMDVDLSQVKVGGMQLESARIASQLRIRGGVGADSAVIGLMVQPGAGMRFNDVKVTLDTVLIFGAGAEVEAAGGGGMSYVAVALPWVRLSHYLEACHHCSAEPFKKTMSCISAAGLSAHAQTLWHRLVTAGAEYGRRAAALGEALIDAAATPQTSARMLGLAHRRRRRVVLEVEDFMRAHLGQAINAEELCRLAGVSRRTLEYGFREMLGVSPKQYLRRLRLHAARRMLLESEPGWGAVRRVARRCGFQHLPEFAGYYRQAFGELPIESLRRAPPACETTV